MEEKAYYDLDITQFLPHREPMLMADRIVEITPEQSETSFFINKDNIFVENGNFVEAGLIENIAQTCSSIFGQNFFDRDTFESKNIIGFITSIKKISVLALPKVGDTIISKAELISVFGNICSMKCHTFLGDTLLSEAEINLFIKENEP